MMLLLILSLSPCDGHGKSGLQQLPSVKSN